MSRMRQSTHRAAMFLNNLCVIVSRQGLALLLCVALVTSYLVPFRRTYAAVTPGVRSIERISDPNTMDSYVQSMLGGWDGTKIVNNYGSRFAGQVWADKTVIAHSNAKGSDVLKLDVKTDGLDSSIYFNEDFLHAFSVLGSSRQVIGETPVDLVMVLDVSGSMGNPNNTDSKIYQSIEAMNDAIHTLMTLNSKNRVGVVLFASYPTVLMPLAHYEPITGDRSTKNNYIQVTGSFLFSNQDGNSKVDSNTDWYVYDIQAVQTTGKTKTVQTGSSGTRSGTKGNATGGDGNGTTFIGSNTNIDGGMWLGLQQLANATDTIETINDQKVSHIPAFIFLGDGDPQIEMTWSGGNWWTPNSGSMTNEGMFVDIPILLSTVMHTSFMKSAVINTYSAAANSANAANVSDVGLNFFTIGIEMGQAGHTGYGPQGAQALLDPGDTAGDGEGFNSSNTSYRNNTYVVQKAYALWESWKNGTGSVTANSCVSGSPYNNQARTFAQLGANAWNVTKEQVIQNINYTDKYYSANAAKEISATLESLITQIATPAFTPVEGINAAGVEGSVTYTDPIGAYMELKDITDLTVFGVRYTIEKMAVYDYEANSAILGTKADNPSALIQEGWYRNSDNVYLGSSLNWYQAKNTGDSPWNYATYRLSYKSARNLVPTLSANREDITEKEQNTVFTFYHITGIYGQSTSGDAWKTVVNPCYSTGAMNENTTFNVDDIHMWLEDTGSYYDEYGSDNVPDTGYQQALYVDLPIEAIPLQVATVTTQSDGTVKAFSTNLENYAQSTPLRIFYTVGFADEYLNSDGSGIDLAKIPYNYLSSHLIIDETEGEAIRKVYFHSNYYSDTSYGDYSTEEISYKRGNPSVTFSPGADNSFYLFQVNRPLYLIPSSVDAEFTERPPEIDLGTLPSGSSTKMSELMFTLKDMLNEKRSGLQPCEFVKGVGDSDPNYWYYIIREYYAPTSDGSGKGEVRYIAIPRKGSEFGSGFADDDIDAGAYLCWYNPFTGEATDYTVNDSATESAGSINSSVVGSPGENFYVSAKAGGLRVGGMSNFIGTKGQEIRGGHTTPDAVANPTDTADNFYLPTISKSSKGNNVVVNIFLGNNGRIVVDSTRLLVTKTVNSTTGVLTDAQKDANFKFTVNIEDFVGTYSAVMVLRDEFDPSLWRRRFDSIDLLVSNEDLLQNPDNTPTMVDESGESIGSVQEYDGSGGYNLVYYYYGKDGELDFDRKYDGQRYYVYIGKNIDENFDVGESNIFRVFQADEADLYGNKVIRGGRTFYINPGQHELSETNPVFRIADEDHLAGERDYWVDEVYLIPVEEVDGNDEWRFGDRGAGDKYTKLEQFVVASLFTVDTSGNTSETELTSPYAIRSHLMLKDVTFRDVYGNGSYGEAVVYLKDGEGLLFYGIDSGANYTVTEQLPDKNSSGESVTVTETINIDGRLNDTGGTKASWQINTLWQNADAPQPKGMTGMFAPRTDEEKLYVGVQITATVAPGMLEDYAKAIQNDGLVSDPAFTARDRRILHYEQTGASFFRIWLRTKDTERYLIDFQYLGQEFGWVPVRAIYPSGSTLTWEDLNDLVEIAAVYSGGTLSAEVAIDKDAFGIRDDFSMYVSYGDHYKDGAASKYQVLHIVSENAEVNAGGCITAYSGETDVKPYIAFSDADLRLGSYVVDDVLEGAYDSIYFQEVRHVQEQGRAITYTYDSNGPLRSAVKAAYIPVERLADGHSCECDENGLHYFWKEGVQMDLSFDHTDTADFSTDNRYAVRGVTSIYEEAIHFVNFIPGIEKVEFEPGADQRVKVRDHLLYGIRWENYTFSSTLGTGVEAKVTIRDPLDPGVDFVRAVFDPDFGNIINKGYDPEAFSKQFNPNDDMPYLDGYEGNNVVLEAGVVPDTESGSWVYRHTYFNEEGIEESQDILVSYTIAYSENQAVGTYSYTDTDGIEQSFTVTVAYDEGIHTVTWVIENAPAVSYGAVGLEVRVNEKANTFWDYETGLIEEEHDFMILNRAGVTVNGYEEIWTDIVENPTGEPSKTETKIDRGWGEETEVGKESLKDRKGDGTLTGPLVYVGDKITYRIDWRNYKTEAAVITVTDVLDPGVDFVRASFGGVTLDSGEETIGSETVDSETVNVRISYDAQTRTVTWILDRCPAFYEGFVELVVLVNEGAKFTWYPGDEALGEDTDYMVRNRASVQVGNDPAVETNVIENPLGEHTEEDPEDPPGEGAPPREGTANLRVHKTVTGSMGETDRSFTFTVTLSDTTVNGWHGDMFFENGVATIYLMHGETSTATGLPVGATYDVVETDNDGYVVTYTGDTGTLETDVQSEAHINNHRELLREMPASGGVSPVPLYAAGVVLLVCPLLALLLTKKKRSAV